MPTQLKWFRIGTARHTGSRRRSSARGNSGIRGRAPQAGCRRHIGTMPAIEMVAAPPKSTVFRDLAAALGGAEQAIQIILTKAGDLEAAAGRRARQRAQAPAFLDRLTRPLMACATRNLVGRVQAARVSLHFIWSPIAGILQRSTWISRNHKTSASGGR